MPKSTGKIEKSEISRLHSTHSYFSKILEQMDFFFSVFLNLMTTKTDVLLARLDKLMIIFNSS